MIFVEAELENCLQPNLQKPSEIHPLRMDFERDYARKGIEYVMKKYADLGWSYKINVIKQRIKRIVKHIIGRK